MKKKAILITAIIIVLIVLGTLFWFTVLAPRIEIDRYIKENTDNQNMQIVATDFDRYDITLSGEAKEISNGHITVDIPERFIKDESVTLSTEVYKHETGGVKECVMLIEVYDWGEEMSLVKALDSSQYLEIGHKIGAEQLKQGFDALNSTSPDSAYNTYKCMYMLSKDDYNFWNLNQQIAYGIMATVKSKIMSAYDDNVFIYEKGDICGFVSYTELTEEQTKDSSDKQARYNVKLEIFNKSDLNTSSTVLMYCNDLNEAFAIMNSAKSVK